MLLIDFMLEVSRVPADLYTNTLCGTGRAGPGPRYKKYINCKLVYKSAGTVVDTV